MNLKQLIKFGLENSSDPVIKNPILRQALEPRSMDQALLQDDLVPGPLKDELAGNFDPSQETYEDYLRRINLERPFNMAEGGQLVAPSVDGSRPGYKGRPSLKLSQFHRDMKNFGKTKYVKDGIKFDADYMIGGKNYTKGLYQQHDGDWAIEARNKKGVKEKITYKNKAKALKQRKINLAKAEESRKTLGSRQTEAALKLQKRTNQWAKNWIAGNQHKYGVRDYDNFVEAFKKAWAIESKADKYKVGFKQMRILSEEGLPRIRNVDFFGVKAPFEKDPSWVYKKIFFKHKLKNPEFNKKIKEYIDFVAIEKTPNIRAKLIKEGKIKKGITLGGTSKINYLKYADFIDDDVMYFMGNVLTDKNLLNPGKGTGMYDIMEETIGKNRMNAYRNKFTTSFEGWRKNLFEVADMAGMDGKKVLDAMYREQDKLRKIYNIDNLPFSFRYAMDHVYGLKEAINYGNPRIARETLQNIVASTKMMNKELGTGRFGAKRRSLMTQLKNAKTMGDKQTIIGKLNTLVSETPDMEGRIKYSLFTKGDKAGELKITNLQPEKTFSKRVKGYETLVEKFPKNVASYLKALCPKGKASGGRIGFATGTPTVECGRKALDKGLATGKWESPEKAKLAKKILQTAGKSGLAGKIGSRLAAELFGPVALASIPVFELGIAGYDTVTAGTPFKEAVNKTLLHYGLGDKWKADPEKLKRKDILKMADGPEKEMLIKLWSNMGNLNRLNNLYEKQYNLEQGKDLYEAVDAGGYGDQGISVAGIDKQIKDVENQIQRAGGEEAFRDLSESVMDPSAIGLAESKEGELIAKRKADSLWGSMPNPYYTSPGSSYRGEVDPERIEAMKAKGPAYGMWGPAGDEYEKLSPEYIKFLNEYYRSQGVIPEGGDVSEYFYDDTGKSILEEEQMANKWKQLMSRPGMLGTQETFAGGGIAGIRRPNAIPPESGPNPQGLPSLYNRVTRI